MVEQQELLGGLKDLEGAGTSLKEIISGLPSEDPDVKTLQNDLKEVLNRLLHVTTQTDKLNKNAKVNRSIRSKKNQGRLTFGCSRAVAMLNLLDLPRHGHLDSR
jgi:translation initiation factor 2B subunit (eIF-2B alpha/beta/delta family)